VRGGCDFAVLFAPRRSAFLQWFTATRDTIAFKVLDDVRSRMMLVRPQGGGWRIEALKGFPAQAVVDAHGLDSSASSAAAGDGALLVYVNDALTPLTMSLVRFGETLEPLKAATARFDARGLAITQHHAQSEDGTRIPYFQIGRADLPHDGSNAVLLTGYGGVEHAMLPYYAGLTAQLWRARAGGSGAPPIPRGRGSGPARQPAPT